MTGLKVMVSVLFGIFVERGFSLSVADTTMFEQVVVFMVAVIMFRVLFLEFGKD